MSKKTFKDNTTNIDRFFSVTSQESNSTNTQEVHGTHKTHEVQKVTESIKYYRFNLKMKPEFKQFLDEESWKARTTVTQYINDLIQADMNRKQKNI